MFSRELVERLGDGMAGQGWVEEIGKERMNETVLAQRQWVYTPQYVVQPDFLISAMFDALSVVAS